jgi:hypothetical protein
VINAFLGCQLFVVLFIALHDWIPLGKLNNVQAARSVDSTGRLAIVTALSALPFGIALAGTAYYAATRLPAWLGWVLWISYAVGLYGMLRTWYVPYLFVNEPARIARYKVRFARTHAFLPTHNGIRPDTLHVCFHAVLIATFVLLVCLTLSHTISL